MVIFDDSLSNNKGDVIMSSEMERKLKVLEQFGFRREDPTVKATVMGQHPREHYYKYRTRMF